MNKTIKFFFKTTEEYYRDYLDTKIVFHAVGCQVMEVMVWFMFSVWVVDA